MRTWGLLPGALAARHSLAGAPHFFTRLTHCSSRATLPRRSPNAKPLSAH